MNATIEIDPDPVAARMPYSARLPWCRNAAAAAVLLLAAAELARWPDLVDRPVSHWMSAQVGKNAFVDRAFFAFDIDFTFSGAALMALIWACWSVDEGTERRSRIVVGVAVAFGAGILSRILQHVLSSHVRPVYDPALDFHVPGGFVVAPLNTLNSFPSDHATVFAGLVALLFTIRSRLALPAALWAAIVESARLYMGAHWASDLIGGAALAAACVWAVQGRFFVALGGLAVKLERTARPLFYAGAFFVSFQVATLFIEIRGLTGGFSLLQSLH